MAAEAPAEAAAPPAVIEVASLEEFTSLRENWADLSRRVDEAIKEATAGLAEEKGKAHNPTKFNPQNMIRLETEKKNLLTEGNAKLDQMFNEACDMWEKTVKPSIEAEVAKLKLRIGTPGEAAAQQAIAACESLIESNERELYG